MMKEKIISIIIGIFIYIVVSCTLHSLLGGSHDVALGILYIYSDMLYMAGFTIAFLFYGLGKINKTLHVVFSIIFLSIYVYCWITAINMPYERFLYIGLGLLVYIGERTYLKRIGETGFNE